MKRRIKVRELIQREELRGEVVELFHSRNTGMIHGDDGYDVTFSQESLVVKWTSGHFRSRTDGIPATLWPRLWVGCRSQSHTEFPKRIRDGS
jgi:hypothetical protein